MVLKNFLKKSADGFTIFEILISISILMSLAVAGSLGYKGQLAKARDVKRKTSLNRIKIALYDRFIDKGCFPVSLPGCGQSMAYGSSSYLTNWPCDPKLLTAYVYRTDPQDCPQWFQLYTNLENTKDPDIDYVHCRNGCGPNCSYNYGVSSTNAKVDEVCYTPPEHDPCNNPKQTFICHNPGKDSQHEICIDNDALPDHFSHHDTLGYCPLLLPSVIPSPKPTKK